MTKTATALIWAAAIIMIAVAGSRGWISRESARTMLIVMPVLAAIIVLRRFRGQRCCGGGQA